MGRISAQNWLVLRNSMIWKEKKTEVIKTIGYTIWIIHSCENMKLFRICLLWLLVQLLKKKPRIYTVRSSGQSVINCFPPTIYIIVFFSKLYLYRIIYMIFFMVKYKWYNLHPLTYFPQRSQVMGLTCNCLTASNLILKVTDVMRIIKFNLLKSCVKNSSCFQTFVLYLKMASYGFRNKLP